MPNSMSQSVKNMIENFMSYHEKGYSIQEIANEFNLSSKTVYYNLEKIAKLNGVDRASLLVCPHTPGWKWKKSVISNQNFDREDMEKLEKDFFNLYDEIDEAIKKAKALITEEV